MKRRWGILGALTLATASMLGPVPPASAAEVPPNEVDKRSTPRIDLDLAAQLTADDPGVDVDCVMVGYWLRAYMDAFNAGELAPDQVEVMHELLDIYFRYCDPLIS